MNKNFRNNSKLFGRRQNGFTLVEMLIVILVLGILVAAIVPNLSRFTSQGVVEAANSELTTIKHTVMAYQSDHSGDFPCSTQPTAGSPQTILIAGSTGIAPYLSASNVVGTYTVDVDGTVKGITYAGLAWDDVNLRWKKV
jgi:prepilin-type N-terminal cleavage/methylation domain-containing protein